MNEHPAEQIETNEPLEIYLNRYSLKLISDARLLDRMDKMDHGGFLEDGYPEAAQALRNAAGVLRAAALGIAPSAALTSLAMSARKLEGT